jgi:tetratricopeptide (TPR) repeat protein
LFVLINLMAASQVNLDSLRRIWNDQKQPDTSRMEAMSTISFEGYIYSNADSAFYFAQLLYDFAKRVDNKKYLAQALNTQGTTFYFKGDYAKAIDYFNRGLKIREAIGDKRGVASSINNMGAIYTDQGESEKALECYKRSLKIREEIGDKDGMAASYNNIGAIYAERKENTLAIEYYTRSLKLREEIGDKVGIGTAYNNIGSIYNNLNDVTKARDYYTRGLKIREQVDDKRGQAMSLYNLGKTYSDEGDFNTAITINERALKTAFESGAVLHINHVSLALYECYKKTGRHKDALGMYELYIKMSDSIKSEASQKAILKQEMQYAYDKQKALDEKEYEKQSLLAAEQEQKQKILSLSIATVLLLALIFSVFAYNRLRITRKQKNIIENQKNIVEEKQKEILDSITYAKRLQDAILPADQHVKEKLPESFILYKPKDIVAGDFYWMEIIRSGADELILIAAADCTGHGVPGALVSVVCSNALNRAVLEFGITEPGEILDKTRELVLETFSKNDTDVKDGMDISLASINKTKGAIKWAGANNPLWYIRGGELQKITANKQPIGKTDAPQPYVTHNLTLLKGDSLILFTDGYADQFGGPKKKKYKYKPLEEFIVKNIHLPADVQKEKLSQEFERWKGTLEQVDDVCIIGVRL